MVIPPMDLWINLLFSNWLNYFVYQTTPYDIMTVGSAATYEKGE